MGGEIKKGMVVYFISQIICILNASIPAFHNCSQLLLFQNGNVDPVEGNEWYHGDITKQEAAEKLASAGPGSWLVRPSDTSKGDYVLYFYGNKQILKFKIQKHGRQYFMGGRYFDRLVCNQGCIECDILRVDHS